MNIKSEMILIKVHVQFFYQTYKIILNKKKKNRIYRTSTKGYEKLKLREKKHLLVLYFR